MKRFSFSLEKLLQLRRYREQETEQALARAMGELASIESRIKVLAEERLAVSANRFTSGKTPAELQNTEYYLLRLERSTASLLEAAAKAELLVDAAREAFLEASKDKKVIDKIRDKRIAEHKKVAQEEEIKAMDDISGGSTARKKTLGS
ncbi:hypothetical protein MASR2M78_26700 [Treponema sp.]